VQFEVTHVVFDPIGRKKLPEVTELLSDCSLLKSVLDDKIKDARSGR